MRVGGRARGERWKNRIGYGAADLRGGRVDRARRCCSRPAGRESAGRRRSSPANRRRPAGADHRAARADLVGDRPRLSRPDERGGRGEPFVAALSHPRRTSADHPRQRRAASLRAGGGDDRADAAGSPSAPPPTLPPAIAPPLAASIRSATARKPRDHQRPLGRRRGADSSRRRHPDTAAPETLSPAAPGHTPPPQPHRRSQAAAARGTRPDGRGRAAARAANQRRHLSVAGARPRAGGLRRRAGRHPQ